MGLEWRCNNTLLVDMDKVTKTLKGYSTFKQQLQKYSKLINEDKFDEVLFKFNQDMNLGGYLPNNLMTLMFILCNVDFLSKFKVLTEDNLFSNLEGVIHAIRLPDNITHLSTGRVFRNCKGVKDIYIPKSIKNLIVPSFYGMDLQPGQLTVHIEDKDFLDLFKEEIRKEGTFGQLIKVEKWDGMKM